MENQGNRILLIHCHTKHNIRSHEAEGIVNTGGIDNITQALIENQGNRIMITLHSSP